MAVAEKFNTFKEHGKGSLSELLVLAVTIPVTSCEYKWSTSMLRLI